MGAAAGEVGKVGAGEVAKEGAGLGWEEEVQGGEGREGEARGVQGWVVGAVGVGLVEGDMGEEAEGVARVGAERVGRGWGVVGSTAGCW